MSTFATFFALSLLAQAANLTEIILPDNTVVSEIATAEETEEKGVGHSKENKALPKSVQAKQEHRNKAELRAVAQKLEPFTGKISKSRVRLRLTPDLSAPILKELTKDDLFIVTDLADDFYAVKPAPQAKGYIFRTYVLDGQIEGNHVNVRLEPDTNAPIVCQMNSGDKVTGKICAANNKWLEIAMPEAVRFFVAKEFVERIGSVQTFYDIEKLKVEIEEKLITLENSLQNELKKSFKDIQLAPLAQELNQIITQKNVISQQVEKAQYLLKNMQEAYLEKSILALQTKTPKEPLSKQKLAQKALPIEASEPVKEDVPMSAQAAESKVTEIVAQQATTKEPETTNNQSAFTALNTNPLPFQELEKKLLHSAIETKSASSATEFYSQEQKRAISLKGVIKPYARPLKNVPGDYMLVDAKSNLPIAYLYSTTVNLHPLIGKEAVVSLVERPNNNFAYPAYFVLKAE